MASSSDPAKTDGVQPPKTELETALSAAAEAGKAEHDEGDIAADDAGASKLSTEIERERELPIGATQIDTDN